MPLWGKLDQANNAPKFKINSRSPNTGIQLFGTGVVGIDDGEMTSKPGPAHAGWQRVRRGAGPVTTINISVGGSGYANTDTIRVSGGALNATATLTTNATGGITTLAITNNGAKFVNNSTTVVAVANSSGGVSAGAGATFTVTLGGRANRVQVETLISQSSMSANGSSL